MDLRCHWEQTKLVVKIQTYSRCLLEDLLHVCVVHCRNVTFNTSIADACGKLHRDLYQLLSRLSYTYLHVRKGYRSIEIIIFTVKSHRGMDLRRQFFEHGGYVFMEPIQFKLEQRYQQQRCISSHLFRWR